MKRKPLIGSSIFTILLLGIGGAAFGFSHGDAVE